MRGLVFVLCCWEGILILLEYLGGMLDDGGID